MQKYETQRIQCSEYNETYVSCTIYKTMAITARVRALRSFVARSAREPACRYLLKRVCVFVVRFSYLLACSDGPIRFGSPTTLHQQMSKWLTQADTLLFDWCLTHCFCDGMGHIADRRKLSTSRWT